MCFLFQNSDFSGFYLYYCFLSFSIFPLKKKKKLTFFFQYKLYFVAPPSGSRVVTFFPTLEGTYTSLYVAVMYYQVQPEPSVSENFRPARLDCADWSGLSDKGRTYLVSTATRQIKADLIYTQNRFYEGSTSFYLHRKLNNKEGITIYLILKKGTNWKNWQCICTK